MNYFFKSERLGFRNWQESDIPKMAKLNANPNVMEFFPSTQNETQTANFVHRMQQHCDEKGFCYFAVDILETGDFIGFIGMMSQDYEAPFTPCVDIGWRLVEQFWNNGYATEGANACLDFAFNTLKINTIISVASEINVNSTNVMRKIGMIKIGNFEHPKLLGNERLKNCVWYEIKNTKNQKKN